MNELWLREDIAAAWRGDDEFAQALALKGEVVRHVAGVRETVCTLVGSRRFYVKKHFGVGWTEILKNLLVGKRPVVDASNEFRAARHLAANGVATLPVAAFGTRGRNPARRVSFLLTEEIAPAISLEDVVLHWQRQPPSVQLKRTLLQRVAVVARRMHEAGVYHRDFYVCHLLLGVSGIPSESQAENAEMHVIDLHRARIRASLPRGWRVKDLAALYFSAMDAGLTRRDLLRFVRTYFDTSLKTLLAAEGELLAEVAARAERLYAKGSAKGILPSQIAEQT